MEAEAETSVEKGKVGRPKGPWAGKRTVPPDDLIEEAANRALAGKPFLSRCGPSMPPSDADKLAVARVLNTSVEEFRSQFSAKMGTIMEKVAHRIEEKLDANEFKSGELGYVLTVVGERKDRLDGFNGAGSTTVNTQVNIYGASSAVQTREQVLASLGEHGPVTDV